MRDERFCMTSEQKADILSNKFLPASQAPEAIATAIRALGCEEIAIVQNPSYIYAPVEIYPMAPKPTALLPRLAGVVKDMDGTTTTTEPLCIHSLEWMVRRVTGRLTPEAWGGLNREQDYPHIIGNSTTKHVEYLLQTYGSHFDAASCLRALIATGIWTLSCGQDATRRAEVRATLVALGLRGVLDDPRVREAIDSPQTNGESAEALAETLVPEFMESFHADSLGEQVRAAVDIYYMRYHIILADIAQGNGARRAEEVLGSADAHLIEPMPGVGAFIAALKGYLGHDLGMFHDELAAHVGQFYPEIDLTPQARLEPKLEALGGYLQANPVPVSIVTSSIAYEADIVLGEVFRILREQVANWPVGNEIKERLLQDMTDPREFYDALITASDSSEIRLKPHRDLYSIALHAMGLSHADFPCVMGLEDSESGITAIRTAGVGLAIAVPFLDTAGHDLSAAAYSLPGQLPELMLLHHCFIDPEQLMQHLR